MNNAVLWRARLGGYQLVRRDGSKNSLIGSIHLYEAPPLLWIGYDYRAVESPKTVCDLHATILHFLGLDFRKLTWRSTAATCGRPMYTDT